jgi:adenylyl-sulfate kinase
MEKRVNKSEAFTVWFTGLSGAGKSTLARALGAHLNDLSLRYEVLDGDEIRTKLCRDLGFSKEDRDENIRRISYLASVLNRHDVITIVAVISPYRAARQKAREMCERFVEVFVDCQLPTLIQRDVKGLYRRALAGDIQNFSGVSDIYEPPETPDIYVNSNSQTKEESFEVVLSGLRKLRYLPRA